MIHSIIAIIAGYVVFAVSAVILFIISGFNPHAEVPLWFLATATIYGMFFAALGGYLAALIANRKGLLHSGILTLVIIAGATGSLLSSPGNEAIWSQVSAILLMAPSAMLGGYIRSRSKKT